jgi:hypothetical protein
MLRLRPVDGVDLGHGDRAGLRAGRRPLRGDSPTKVAAVGSPVSIAEETGDFDVTETDSVEQAGQDAIPLATGRARYERMEW